VKKKKRSQHHIVPSSRGGRRTVILPNEFHKAWHFLFVNLTPDEITDFVIEMHKLMRKSEEITWEQIEQLQSRLKRES